MRTPYRLALAIVLLLLPLPAQSLIDIKAPQPPAKAATALLESLYFKPAPRPDYDREVLSPLRAAQAQLAEDNRKAQAAAIALAAQEAASAAANAKAALATVPVAPVLPGGSAKEFIYLKESGNNPGAINKYSGACGIGQALPCSKLPCSLSDYACQDYWFTNNYMIPRYGTWENARAFWLAHGWW